MFATTKKTEETSSFVNNNPNLRLSKNWKGRLLGVHQITPIGSIPKVDRIYFDCKKRTNRDAEWSLEVLDSLRNKKVTVFVPKKTRDLVKISEAWKEEPFYRSITKVFSIFQGVEIREGTFYPVSENPKFYMFCHGDNWEMYKEHQGGFNKVLVSESTAFKFGKNPNMYREERQQLRRIYERLGEEREFTGYQKKNTIQEGVSFALYDPTRKSFTSICGHTEIPYRGTLHEAIKKTVPQKEVLSICRCLIEGSIAFLGNEIIPLDVKIDNIGYLGEGRVEHFDFSQSIIGGSRRMDKYDTTAKAVWSKEREELSSLRREDRFTEAESLSRKMHIFQLGIVFYQIVSKQNPFPQETLQQKKGITGLHSKEFLEGVLEKTYSRRQTDTILRMLSEERNNRPDILEIKRAFSE